jgi:hypothetical protein
VPSKNPRVSDEQVAAVVGFLRNMEKVQALFAVAFDELRNREHAPPIEQSTVLRDHTREYESLCRQFLIAIPRPAPDDLM